MLGGVEPSEERLINATDFFLLQHRLSDGYTVLEHFVEVHPELASDEREMLLGWRDAVEGLFEVERREGEALLAVNLFDDLPYRIRSNRGPRFLKGFAPGFFFQARVVPVGEEWVLSGVSTTYPAEDRDEVYAAAYRITTESPRFALMNPIGRERAWQRQREDRGRFIAFFGSDTVVLSPQEYVQGMDATMLPRLREAAEAAGQRAPTELPEPLRTRVPEGFEDAETIGVIYDAIEGQHILPDFGRLVEAFAHPELAATGPHRDVVLDYLYNPEMHPLPLRRLAGADPKRASAVFRAALNRPTFSWKRSGEALLRKHKPDLANAEPLPGTTVIGQRLTDFMRARSEAAGDG